jgi:PKD repeat protein
VGAIAARAHAYADNGSYTVTVSVTDANGSSSLNSFTVNVANIAPTGQLSAPATATAGTNVPVSMLNALDVSGADLAANLRYAFACDGSSLAGATYASAGTASAINCVYTSAGTRTVRARVIDKDGGFSEYTANVAVSVVAQDVTAGTGTAASELTFVKKNHEYNGSVTITNNTALPFPGPIYVVFEGINVNRVRLQNATGTYQGKYYIMLNVASLEPGASLTFPITFWNPSSADMDYTLKVFAGKLP